ASNANISAISFGGDIVFSGNSRAGNANIGFLYDFTQLTFEDSSTADHATIASGGSISFLGASKGGTAQIRIAYVGDGLGVLDISGHNAPGVTIGSLEAFDNGSGIVPIVVLGGNTLT